MKKNICIIGLATNFTKTIAKALADKIDMFYADINELLKFDLLDVEQAKKVSGKEYVAQLESNKIKTVASYENTLITLSYSSLTNNENYELLNKECLIIYLRLSPQMFETVLLEEHLTKSQNKIELSVFNDRDFISSKVSDTQINVKTQNVQEVVKLLLKGIKAYYSK